MADINTLVLYKNFPALVSGFTEGKYIVEYCANQPKKNKKIEFTSQKIREKDFVPMSKFKAIKEDLVEFLTTEFDSNKHVGLIEELHELFLADGVKEISFEDLCDYADILSAKECLFFFKSLQHSPLFLQGNTEFLSFRPRTEEEVEAEKQKKQAKDYEDQTRKEFIERLKGKKLVLPDDAKFLQDVEAVALGSSDKSKTMKEVGIKETPEKAHKLLLDTGVWSTTKNPHPSRQGISMHSATETLASPPQEDRVVVSHTAYAIDNAWSTDPDDAIAFDGQYVWVHIADPASTVMPDSTVDINARGRGATLYIPEGAARMLCESCLEDYALGLSNPSKALSFKIQLDDNGSILSCEVLKTLVQVTRLTYEYVDSNKTRPELAVLFDIARKNEQRRIKAGAVTINLPEVHISVDEGVVHIQPCERTASSDVVREFMLLAGEAAAKYAFKNNIPFPFVSQEKPDIPKDLPDGLAGQYKLRRHMRSRSVGVTPKQHAGLGLGMYSQVTSPLRRYSDLIAHQQLRAFLDGRTVIGKDEMLERIARGDAATVATAKAERNSRLHWTLVYLAQNPNWTADAVVVELKGKTAVCLIPSLALETTIFLSKSAKLNEAIKVKAGKINIPELSVSFLEI